MNYLAHLYFAEDTPESRVGNLLTDFVRGPVEGQPLRCRDHTGHAEPCGCGPLHRRPRGGAGEQSAHQPPATAIRGDHRGCLLRPFSCAQLDGVFGRTDFPLSSTGPTIPSAPTGAICRRLMSAAIRHMVRHDWLHGYQEVSGIGRALDGLSRRIPALPTRWPAPSRNSKRTTKRWKTTSCGSFQTWFGTCKHGVTMGRHYDVIVVGIGAMGSAAAYHLAVRGRERARIGTLRSAPRPGQFPRVFPPDEDRRVHGHALRAFHRTFLRTLAPARGRIRPADPGHDRLSAHGRHRYVGPFAGQGAPTRSCPATSWPTGIRNSPSGPATTACTTRSADCWRPELAMATHIIQALRRGAEIHGRETVTGWKETPHCVEVETDRGRYSADQVIFTGGSWSAALIEDLGISLTVSRQPLAWVWPATGTRRPSRRARCRFGISPRRSGTGTTTDFP